MAAPASKGSACDFKLSSGCLIKLMTPVSRAAGRAPTQNTGGRVCLLPLSNMVATESQNTKDDVIDLTESADENSPVRISIESKRTSPLSLSHTSSTIAITSNSEAQKDYDSTNDTSSDTKDEDDYFVELDNDDIADSSSQLLVSTSESSPSPFGIQGERKYDNSEDCKECSEIQIGKTAVVTDKVDQYVDHSNSAGDDENFPSVESPHSTSSQLFIAEDIDDDVEKIEEPSREEEEEGEIAYSTNLQAVSAAKKDPPIVTSYLENLAEKQAGKVMKSDDLRAVFAGRQFQPFVKLFQLDVDTLKKYCGDKKYNRLLSQTVNALPVLAVSKGYKLLLN